MLIGDCIQTMRTLPDQSVNTCVTSPPYYGLRDYDVDGQMGREESPAAFVANMVDVFREVRRVLRDDGTVWLNLGDSYARRGNTDRKISGAKARNTRRTLEVMPDRKQSVPEGLKEKDLMGIPWRVAFALQDDGWYLRQDIIWAKPNPMPESVSDRFTNSHEHLFLLSKRPKYFFDQESVLEPCSPNTHARLSQKVQDQIGSGRANGGTRTDRPMKAVGRKFDPGAGNKNNPSFDAAMAIMPEKRNRRSVWTVATMPYKGAHFATFPPALIEPCILAGCPVGGVVLDPFGGSGTTAGVALKNGRRAVLCELNPKYETMMRDRIASIAGPLVEASQGHEPIGGNDVVF